MERDSFHGIAHGYTCHRCPVPSLSPMSCTTPPEGLTLTLPPTPPDQISSTIVLEVKELLSRN
jgi:hypothetical protein